MLKIFKSKIRLITLVVLLMGCAEESFLDQPPRSNLTIDNFFNNDDQLLAAGAAMYHTPWFYYNYHLLACAGDIYAGNASSTGGSFAQFRNWNLNATNDFVHEGYFSLWWVVATANTVLDNLENRLGPDVTEEGVQRVKGEAMAMRAIAYFQLVQLFGDIPILDANMEDYAANTLLPKNPVADVYQFIIQDLSAASEMLPSSRQENGRLSEQVANAFLAKVHLTLGNHNEALTLLDEVISSGQFALLPEYGNLYKEEFDNNSESVFALQWVACQGWGQGNTTQAWTAPFGENITTVGDGWGSYKPSQDLIDAYEEGDGRKYHTIMENGNYYPDLKSEEGGYTYNGTVPHFRKYVSGSPAEGNVCFMSTGNNTYLMRYADVLLMHAEAILGTNGVTTDAAALASFNQVRERAGLEAKTSITKADLLHERRVEFAYEGQYFFDLKRLMDKDRAKSILLAQQRGTIENPYQLASINDSQFILPIPQADVDKNPMLAPDEAPVPYDFGNQ
ncbi:RagB/SusD family nutrient uptake outer membrane protein [Marinoscillum furvescens]|uniref:Putative outer membrane starch-binding protein n=1 Tax=Marinoscillum furvescens DSM 4134 TaxID=1122208 RepID=A0A3D9L8E1_MARFU|nr:RagB/SusD family nutrient uptake outer membrane protein [Marinoscillum furvescens]REE01556.1 putative outer membrane starch-binding protein [Marinoscillum furvescens DSM 4134]